jgi:hypothetical protein
MSPTPDLPTLFSAFIADEDAALETEEQGLFWPMNSRLVRDALPKAPLHLAPADRHRLYFHFLRQTAEIPVVPDKELPHLVEGYRRLLPWLDTSQAALAQRHALLFGFGFDDMGTLPDGATESSQQLKDYTRFMRHCTKYRDLIGQQAKIRNFSPYAHHGERAYQTLTHLGYYHDRRYGPESFGTADRLFWGMVIVILLHEGRRLDLLLDLVDGRYPIPQKNHHLRLLHHYVQAVLSAVPIEDKRFHALAERLAALRLERREATESMAFARALSLPLKADEEWCISICIPTADNTSYPSFGPNLSCEIRPDPEYQWHVHLDLRPGLFSDRSGLITQNDMEIDGLGAGHLLNFPAWIRNTGTKLGIQFDVERAIVDCGRNRAVAKQIMEWLSK